jgi:mannose-6-phosphate isomerase
MTELYPLRFEPVFRRYLWGGRRLQTVLNKPIGDGEDYAESWEVVDHGDDQSVVQAGWLTGHTLSDIVSEHNEALFGRHAGLPQFPLLFKFLDCHRNLSVQVHPDDEAAAKLDPPDLGKTEAWVIMHAEPGSRVYAGLKRGFDRAALQREVNRGTTELCLHSFGPKAGDCIFIPAGTVHALGEGLLVAEIQQASDTTYRLFDWNRVDSEGKARQLHVQAGLEAIDYEAGPVLPQAPEPTDEPEVERLVDCDKFVLDRWRLNVSRSLQTGDCFQLLAVLEGELLVSGDDAQSPLRKGQTMLIPASVSPVTLTPSIESRILVIRLP